LLLLLLFVVFLNNLIFSPTFFILTLKLFIRPLLVRVREGFGVGVLLS
jgi:hypothetical protein